MDSRGIQVVGAGVLGFVSAWFMFKSKQRSAGCPRADIAGIPQHGPYKEFSVIYTDRAVNMLSPIFTEAMQDIARVLKSVYNAESLAIIPGSGTYAMEAVARQFGSGQKVMILRNGYFSFRWTDIFNITKCAKEEIVLKAQPIEEGSTPHFAPHPIEDVVAAIHKERPAVVFAPHVETSTGMIIPDDYIKAVSDACHEVGALFVLDCIASGNVWVDMKATGVDVLISAPQKGWTGPACVGIAMLSARARKHIDENPEPAANSFCCRLAKWVEVMDKYVGGGAMYYTTLPTDSLMRFRDVLLETEAYGIQKTKENMWDLGNQIRGILVKNGFKSVSAPGVQSPGVVVSYSPHEGMYAKFKAVDMQIAGGVPFKLDEDTKCGVDARKQCFRIGLFGLDKLRNISTAVASFETGLNSILAKEKSKL